jgi:acyl-CoA thioesterase
MKDMVQNPVEYARNIVGKDPYAAFLGIEVDEVREGYARCSLTIKPEYLNAADRAHGAIIYSIADQAFAVGSNSMGSLALALSFTINYLGPAIDGEKVFSEATPVNVSRKISVWNVTVRGSGDRIIATGQGVAYHKS